SVTRQSGFLMRLSTPSAMSESSSLKPWKVRIAMCMGGPLAEVCRCILPDRRDEWICVAENLLLRPLGPGQKVHFAFSHQRCFPEWRLLTHCCRLYKRCLDGSFQV